MSLKCEPAPEPLHIHERYLFSNFDLMIMKVADKIEAMLNPYLVEDLGFGFYGSGFRVRGLRVWVWSLGFRV